MYSIKTVNLNNNKYLISEKDNSLDCLGILHDKRFKTSISLPKLGANCSTDTLTKGDITCLGYLESPYSSLQIINTSSRLDTSFIFEKQSYVQDINIVKHLLESASDKTKGLIVFDNDGEIQKHLKRKNVTFNLYTKNDIKMKLEDLNEKILLDSLALSNREQSVLASIMHYKESNKNHSDLNIPVLDGSNWLYNFFITEPSSLAQQFKVNEYSIKMLAVTLRKLYDNSLMSEKFSNINDILHKYYNGEIVILDIPDEDKKFLKSVLSNKSKSSVLMVDNIYHKFNNIQYILYDCTLFENSAKDFKSFIINKHSCYLQKELSDTLSFKNELPYMDFEYLVTKKGAFPIIITIEEHQQSTVNKKSSISRTNTANFF